METQLKRRGGGRAARLTARAIGVTGDDRPVCSGMTGGTLRPLGDDDMRRIHAAALRALAEIGLPDRTDL